MKTIKEEQEAAVKKYGHFNSTHEAYAVLKEEVEEFWELCRKSKQDGKLKQEMIDELIQIASFGMNYQNCHNLIFSSEI